MFFRSILVLLLISLLNVAAPAADKPIVAVWLNRHLMAEGEPAIKAFLQDSARRGVTHVFPNFWFHGRLIYPGSNLAPQHPDFCGWDPMEVVVREAHANGLKVWPWGEYGFFMHYNTTLDEKDCGWILTHHPDWKIADKDGHTGLLNEGMKVMHFSANPAHPAARAFLIDLHLDIARRYPIDGINTDRFRYMNTAWGHDPFSQDVYTKARATDPALTLDDWRQSVITNFAAEFAARWRAEFPDRPISAAVNPPSMYRDKFQYFDEWVRAGNLDYPVPMIYGNTELFRKELERTKAMLPEGTPVIAGIDAGQGEETFAALVSIAREQGAAGVAIWDDLAWRKLHYSFPEPTPTPEARATQ